MSNKEMAEEFLYSWNICDPRADHMMQILMMITQLDAYSILDKIKEMADA